MAGYSGTPLSAKLGIKSGYEIHLVGVPDGYLKLVEPMPENVKIGARLSKNTDLVHVFTSRKTELALPLGFVDIKVCAVTEVWSGLKLVIRKELREAQL